MLVRPNGQSQGTVSVILVVYNVILSSKSAMLCLLYLFILQLTYSSVQISPFRSTLFQPANIHRMTASPTLSATTTTFTAIYPSTPFTAAPLVIASVISLKFQNGLKYSLVLTNITATALTASVDNDSTLKLITVAFLVMDSQLYSVAFSSFNYSQPGAATGTQSFSVTGMEAHSATFLLAVHIQKGTLPAGFAPAAVSQAVSSHKNILTSNLTITYNPQQISIKHMNFTFINLNASTFTAKPYDKQGQRFLIYGTSGIVTDVFSTPNSWTSYSKNYLTGLLTIYDGQFLFGPLFLDIASALTTRVYYFSSQLLLVSNRCPDAFPITDAARAFCYSSCEKGFYYDDQYMCQPCSNNCLQCSMTATNCTACLTPWVLSYGFVCACPYDTYQETLGNGSIQCIKCFLTMEGCRKCTSYSTCTHCMNNLALISTTTCSCAGTLTNITLGNQIYCVDLGLAQTEECSPNFVQIQQTCQCRDVYNLTITAGQCN